nr:hypothetical protein [uncultured Azospirillum sp.]
MNEDDDIAGPEEASFGTDGPDPDIRPPPRKSGGETTVQRNRNERGLVASRKNGIPMPWKREAERDFMHLLESAPEVRSYEGRQGAIAVNVDGEILEHRVQFKVEVADASGRAHTVMVDVFGSLDGAKGRLVNAVADHYSARAIHYVAITEAEVARQPRLGNAKAVLAGGAAETPEEFLLALSAALARAPATLGELERALSDWRPAGPTEPPTPLRHLIYAATLRGCLRLELHKEPISEHTPILT